MRLIRPAALRLPDNELERHSTWLELFFDLIFAVVITELASRQLQHLTYLGILQSSALSIPVMWIWISYTVFAARFDNSDVIHWLMTFIIMFASVIMAIQIPVALEGGAFGFTIGFLIAQISLILLYIRAFYDDSTPQNILFLYVFGFGLAGIFWIISLFFNPPIKFILWTFGMCGYLVIPWLGRKRILLQAPLDTAYIPERFGLFIIIILGQTIASVIIGLQSAHWNLSSIITSSMAFIIAIIIWGQYYRFTQIADYKCTLSSGQPYIYAHIPLIIGLIIMGVCVENYIKVPALINDRVNIIFSIAIVLYLTSFYLLQYITIRKYKIRGISYFIGIIIIIILSLCHLSPCKLMTIFAFIFMLLFGIQYSRGFYDMDP